MNDSSSEPNTSENSTTQRSKGRSRQSKRRSRRRRSKSRSSSSSSPVSPAQAIPVAAGDIIAAFVACGRCSFFMSGYRAMRGNEGFIADAVQASDNWLAMVWQPALIPLIEKSYGMSFRDGMFQMEHMCHECGRVVVYRLATDEDADSSQPIVRVQIMPGD